MQIEKYEVDKQQEKYRIFISYARPDHEKAGKIAAALTENGLTPLWDDENLDPGEQFIEKIKALIANSHVFLTLLTDASFARPWVHEEIGYALALNVPVIPVIFRTDSISPEKDCLPSAMIQYLEVLQVSRDDQKLREELSKNYFQGIIKRYSNSKLALFQRANSENESATMISNYAKDITKISSGAAGYVRQSGGLSSFQIPNQPIDNPVWQMWSGNQKNNRDTFSSLQEERTALEYHANVKGCKLIINPYFKQDNLDRRSAIIRLRILIEFLQNVDAQVAVDEDLEEENPKLTIVGDWFSAEKVLDSGTNGEQTLFTRHAPSNQEKIKKFDEEFCRQLARHNWTAANSKDQAINLLQRIRNQLCQVSANR
jgi:hypothetical protein